MDLVELLLNKLKLMLEVLAVVELLMVAEAEAEARKSQILESAHTEISELVLSAAQKLVEGTEEEDRTHELYDAFLAQEEEMLKRRKKL